MRKFGSGLVVSMVLVMAAHSQDTNSVATNTAPIQKIAAADAEKHYDETLIVTGKITQVTFRPAVVILNFDKPFPDSPFSAVIFARATNRFGNLSSLKGKDVEIKGAIKKYRNKPEIILESTNQLVIVGMQAGTGGAEKK